MHHHSPRQSPQPLYTFLTSSSSSSSSSSPSPSPSPSSSFSTTLSSNKIPTPFILLLTSLFSFLLILSFSTSPSHSPPPHLSPHPSLFPTLSSPHPHSHRFLFHPSNPKSPPPLPTPPSLAYLLTGSKNHTLRILRLLHSIYHPKNFYLLHLDKNAPQTDRDFLARTVQSNSLFRAAQNVLVVGQPDFAFEQGSSCLSATLRGASILLKLSSRWDWFINLSAEDYPLVTQDDLLHILSYVPKDLNFANHSSYIGWKESRRLKPIIVDSGLYLSEIETFYATQKRALPSAFRLFTGSSSAILSRKFIEFCILGTENLPRTLLMYLANTPQAHTVYFPTTLCNSQQFNQTTINDNFQYSSFNSMGNPLHLNSSLFDDLIQSGAAFASPFPEDDPILDRIDQEVLHRSPGRPVSGGWCLGYTNDICSSWGDADILQPGPGASRLENRFVQLLSNGTFRSHQCVFDQLCNGGECVKDD